MTSSPSPFGSRLQRLIGGLIVLAMGCADPFRPASIAGIYAMAKLNGVSPPVPIPVSSLTLSYLADTLALNADGHGSLVSVYEYPLPSGAIERVRRVSPVRVSEREGQLYVAIDYWCDRVECLPPPRHLLTPVGSTLFLRYGNDVREFRPLAQAP